MKIEAVILYCSNDKKFFEPCIRNLLTCGITCNVVAYDHFYMGEPEDMEHLNRARRYFRFHENFKWVVLPWKPGKTSLYWEAYGRWYATTATVSSDADYILYIDIDEILDYVNFIDWFYDSHQTFTSIKLKQYVYWITPRHRLKVFLYNTILCKASYAKSLPFKADARLQYWNNTNLISRWLGKLGLNPFFKIYRGTSFIHHYTGARSLAEMRKKAVNWSHNTDYTVDQMAATMEIKDGKINTYDFEIVDNKFNL